MVECIQKRAVVIDISYKGWTRTCLKKTQKDSKSILQATKHLHDPKVPINLDDTSESSMPRTSGFSLVVFLEDWST